MGFGGEGRAEAAFGGHQQPHHDAALLPERGAQHPAGSGEPSARWELVSPSGCLSEMLYEQSQPGPSIRFMCKHPCCGSSESRSWAPRQGHLSTVDAAAPLSWGHRYFVQSVMEQPISTIWPLHHLVSSAPLIQDSPAIKYNVVLMETQPCCALPWFGAATAPAHAWGKAQHRHADPLPGAPGGTRAEKGWTQWS